MTRWLLLIVVAGCGGDKLTEEDFSLQGYWAVEDNDDVGRATKTEIEFFKDGTWQLQRDGKLCDTPVIGAWYCDEEGTWELKPKRVVAEEPTTLSISPKGQRGKDDFKAEFIDPDTFCWKKKVLGEECLLRQKGQ